MLNSARNMSRAIDNTRGVVRKNVWNCWFDGTDLKRVRRPRNFVSIANRDRRFLYSPASLDGLWCLLGLLFGGYRVVASQDKVALARWWPSVAVWLSMLWIRGAVFSCSRMASWGVDKLIRKELCVYFLLLLKAELIIPWRRVRLAKLVFSELVKNASGFY